MSTEPLQFASFQFGRVWFEALNNSGASTSGSLLTGVTTIHGVEADLGAIVPDRSSRYPRARAGEVGIQESLELARWVRSLPETTAPLILIIDVPSQAYGYYEELLGINFALAASTEAVAEARLSGRPVIALVVGKAISGAFLATGLQANRIVSLLHEGVQVQVMSKRAAARITQRSVEDLDRLADTVPAMAFDVESFGTLGAVHELLEVTNPKEPSSADLDRVRTALDLAVRDVTENKDITLGSRLASAQGAVARRASIEVRKAIDENW